MSHVQAVLFLHIASLFDHGGPFHEARTGIPRSFLGFPELFSESRGGALCSWVAF